MRDMPSGLRRAIVASVLAGLAFAASPARAADDGYANVFSSLFGALGVIKPDPAPDIAYGERPPLVLPPQPGLPKPAEPGKRTAAWPKDPDVLRHRKEQDEARVPQTSNERTDIVSQAELAKGRGESEAYRPNECNANRDNRACLLLTPDELKAEGDRYAADNPTKSEDLTAGQEPTRDFLTQPPKGYMKPTRTVKATTDGPPLAIDESNPRAFLMARPKTDE